MTNGNKQSGLLETTIWPNMTLSCGGMWLSVALANKWERAAGFLGNYNKVQMAALSYNIVVFDENKREQAVGFLGNYCKARQPCLVTACGQQSLTSRCDNIVAFFNSHVNSASTQTLVGKFWAEREASVLLQEFACRTH